MDEPTGGKLVLDVGRDERAVADAEGRDEAGPRTGRANLVAAAGEASTHARHRARPWGSSREDRRRQIGRPYVGDAPERKIERRIAFAGIERTRRLAQAGKDAHPRAGLGLDGGHAQERTQPRRLERIAGARLDPVDVESERHAAKSRLPLRDGALELDGLATTSIEDGIDQGSIDRRIPGGARRA